MNNWIPILGLIVNLVPGVALAFTTLSPAASAIPDVGAAAASGSLRQPSLADRSDGCERRYRAGWARMTSRPSERRAARRKCIAAAEASTPQKSEPTELSDVEKKEAPTVVIAPAPPATQAPAVEATPEPIASLPPVASPEPSID